MWKFPGKWVPLELLIEWTFALISKVLLDGGNRILNTQMIFLFYMGIPCHTIESAFLYLTFAKCSDCGRGDRHPMPFVGLI